MAGLKLTFLALPCSSPETAGWLLKPCLTFRAVSSSCKGGGRRSACHEGSLGGPRKVRGGVLGVPGGSLRGSRESLGVPWRSMGGS